MKWKPVYESLAEIENLLLNCDFMQTISDEFLKDRFYSTERYDAIVRNEPLGVILGIMPWNFSLLASF